MGCHPGPVSAPASFRERLHAPWWAWPVAGFWALTLGVAYGSAISAPVGLGVGLLAFGLASAGLIRAAVIVAVDVDGLHVGRALLPPSCLGPVEVLDRSAARRRRGQGADPRAFLLLRGWIAEAVVVAVVDDHDPTPYWFVSSRRPAELAGAIEAVARADTNGRGVTGSASGPGSSAPTASVRKDPDGLE